MNRKSMAKIKPFHPEQSSQSQANTCNSIYHDLSTIFQLTPKRQKIINENLSQMKSQSQQESQQQSLGGSRLILESILQHMQQQRSEQIIKRRNKTEMTVIDQLNKEPSCNNQLDSASKQSVADNKLLPFLKQDKESDQENKEIMSQLKFDDETQGQNYSKQLLHRILVSPHHQSQLYQQNDNREQEFYTHYKNMNYIADVNSFLNDSVSPFIKMLSQYQSEMRFPKKLGLVQTGDNGQQDKSSKGRRIFVKHYNIGDSDAKPFAEGLTEIDDLEIIDVSHNRFTDNGVGEILKKMKPTTQSLDLSYNNITAKTCMNLSQIIGNSTYQLKELNLEGNKLTDQQASLLVKGFNETSRVKKLNLSSNKLTDIFCQNLKPFLASNPQLAELYLYWNLFTSKGGKAIAESLCNNDYLRVLDLSHNAMGQGYQSCAPAWQRTFARDQQIELCHVDFSFNHFGDTDCRIIAEGLKKNHTIFGFHFQGNYWGEIDCQGFLNIPQQNVGQQLVVSSSNNINNNSINGSEKEIKHVQKPGMTSLSTFNANQLECPSPIFQRIHGVELQEHSQGGSTLTYPITNCWICEGWIEKKFFWKPLVSGPVDKDPIFIHFSTDEFVPHLMQRNTENNNVFEFQMMFPPNCKVYYFFTAQGNQVTALEQMKEQNPRENIKISFQDNTVSCQLQRLNYVKFGLPQPLFTSMYSTIITCAPRSWSQNYNQPKKESIKIIWSLEKSLFKEYIPDTPEIIEQCFDQDFKQTKIFKIIQKGEDEEIDDNLYKEFKQYLLKIYPQIKSCYKYLSSLNPVGESWNISKQVMKEFILGNTKVVDGWLINNNDCEVQFFACNNITIENRMGSMRNLTNNNILNNSNNNSGSQYKIAINNIQQSQQQQTLQQLQQQQLQQQKQNDQNSQLYRHHLLELFVRLANCKYLNNSAAKNILDAIRRLFVVDGIEEAISKLPDDQSWREKNFWTEKCDFCIQFYKPVLENVYKTYLQGRNSMNKASKNKFFKIDQFKQLISDLNLKANDRDINLAFHMPIMTQVDELTKTKHLELNFIEFVEAIARLSEVISIPPYGFSNEDIWTSERTKQLPLHVLIESICVLMYNQIVKKQLTEEEFVLPDESLFHVEIQLIKEGKALFQRTKNVIKQKIMMPISIVSSIKNHIVHQRRFSRKPSITDPKQVAQLLQRTNKKKTTKISNPLAIIKQIDQN